MINKIKNSNLKNIGSTNPKLYFINTKYEFIHSLKYIGKNHGGVMLLLYKQICTHYYTPAYVRSANQRNVTVYSIEDVYTVVIFINREIIMIKKKSHKI